MFFAFCLVLPKHSGPISRFPQHGHPLASWPAAVEPASQKRSTSIFFECYGTVACAPHANSKIFQTILPRLVGFNLHCVELRCERAIRSRRWLSAFLADGFCTCIYGCCRTLSHTSHTCGLCGCIHGCCRTLSRTSHTCCFMLEPKTCERDTVLGTTATRICFGHYCDQHAFEIFGAFQSRDKQVSNFTNQF